MGVGVLTQQSEGGGEGGGGDCPCAGERPSVSPLRSTFLCPCTPQSLRWTHHSTAPMTALCASSTASTRTRHVTRACTAAAARTAHGRLLSGGSWQLCSSYPRASSLHSPSQPSHQRGQAAENRRSSTPARPYLSPLLRPPPSSFVHLIIPSSSPHLRLHLLMSTVTPHSLPHHPHPLRPHPLPPAHHLRPLRRGQGYPPHAASSPTTPPSSAKKSPTPPDPLERGRWMGWPITS